LHVGGVERWKITIWRNLCSDHRGSECASIVLNFINVDKYETMRYCWLQKGKRKARRKVNVDCLIVYYRGCVRVERLLGRSAGHILQVIPSEDVEIRRYSLFLLGRSRPIVVRCMECRGLEF
jgi:hypothetical protein